MEGMGRTLMLRSGQVILRLENRKRKEDFRATLSHEIFHVVEFLFYRLGIGYSEKSSEAFAYQIEYLTGSIYEKLNARKNR